MRPTYLSLCMIFACVLAAEAIDSPTHPCPIDADLWVMGGQSNMCVLSYRPDTYGFLDKPFFVDERRGMVFGLDNKWQKPVEPIHGFFDAEAPVYRGDFQKKPRPDCAGKVGPGTAFAKHIIENTDRNIGLIPCALGGSSMEMWDPSLKDQGGKSLYGAMIERIEMVGGNIKGVIWHQGESDRGTLEAAQQYEKRMLKFIDSLRRDTGIPDLPIIYAQLGRLHTSSPSKPQEIRNIEIVREAQRRIMLQRDHVYVIGTMNLDMEDHAHLSSQGQHDMGVRMAEVALSEIYDVPGHGTAINLESAEVKVSDTLWRGTREKGVGTISIVLRFSGVTGRLKTTGGRPAHFELHMEEPGTGPCYFRTQFDPKDPAAVIVRCVKELNQPIQLYYGSGLHPYINIIDEKGMLVPAFGPIEIKPEDLKS